MLTSVIQGLIGTSTFTQILFVLPLSLDWLGPPSFLLLSLLLTTYYFCYATIKLATKNTPVASLLGLFDLVQPFVPAGCALVTCYLYLHPAEAGAETPHILGINGKRILGVFLPALYAQVLRFVSPLFSVLEGVATLLVAQCAGRITKAYIEEGVADDREEFEWRRMFALVAAAVMYCAGAGWLIAAHPLSPPFSKTQLPPILLGGALATVFFLTMIGFSRRSATVVETALIFLYVIYSAWISGKEELLEPRSFGHGWLTTGWGKAKALPTELLTGTTPSPYITFLTSSLHLPSSLSNIVGFFLSIFVKVCGLQSGWLSGLGLLPTVFTSSNGGGNRKMPDAQGLDMVGLATNILQHATDTMWKVAGSLPPTMLISLCFRLLVLSAAARIIPMIRRASAGWDAGEEDRESFEGGDFWDGKRLREEPACSIMGRKSGGGEWINIFITLGIWALELVIEDEFDDDGESIKSWKVD
ncbi:hypothetical protein QFC22_002236 [Naganishia vaughanmartiniae]|uniref:Uncharacterized protein n=1 Tax=Naganishia vaughanmartiniae TaxID=1424756 RepID=A0ACC2XF04_9TREE|nr:hypothetical protein QFC22_002236 [Naganishia vaughanmartiniae]